MAFKLFNDMQNQFEVEPQSKDVRGFDVFDKDGNHIGNVKDLLVDPDNDNAINYALVSGEPINSTLGEDLIVPLRKMDIDDADRSVHLDKSLDELKGFPKYSSIDDPDLRQKVDGFFGPEMYQRPIEGRERLGRPMTIPVIEEHVEVMKQVENTGEIAVTMEEEMERRPITEEVHGNRIEIERHKIDNQPLADYEKAHDVRELKPGETISMPATEERIRVTKKPVVVEEIVVRHIPTTRQVAVDVELEKEHVRVEEHKAGEPAPQEKKPAA
ncbi:MAG TPA: PRC and DUF2382 domain-containing protein [Candidatus Aquicultor sp.]|jgi:uncharacterized protein (TIGR02271 family)